MSCSVCKEPISTYCRIEPARTKTQKGRERWGEGEGGRREGGWEEGGGWEGGKGGWVGESREGGREGKGGKGGRDSCDDTLPRWPIKGQPGGMCHESR
jgi:hypothetical protein